MTPRVTHFEADDHARFLRSLSERLRPVEGWGTFRRGARAAAVTVILYRRGAEWRIPFVLRRDDLPSHPGQVGLPGGGVNAGESAWEAASREVEEEIGVPAGELRALGSGPSVYAAVTNYSVVPFVAWLEAPPEAFVHDPGELQRVLEVPLERLLDRAAWREDGRWFGRYLELGDVVLWGLTVRLLDGVLPALRGAP